MRFTAYIIAVLAAVGIFVAIVALPPKDAPDSTDPAVVSAVDSDSPRVMAEAGTLVLSVPQMHCEFACFPNVKKTLESDALVESVALDKQAEEGTIDNRQVVVTYKAGFNLDEALTSLGENGFDQSDLVQ